GLASKRTITDMIGGPSRLAGGLVCERVAASTAASLSATVGTLEKSTIGPKIAAGLVGERVAASTAAKLSATLGAGPMTSLAGIMAQHEAAAAKLKSFLDSLPLPVDEASYAKPVSRWASRLAPLARPAIYVA